MRAQTAHRVVVDEVERARQVWQSGAAGQARKLLERHLGKFPEDTRALHLQAVVAMAQGSHTQACELMATALGLEPDNADFWCDFGTALHGKGEREAARDAYLRALEGRPDHLDALFNLANVLRELKQLKDCLQCYSALLERNPEYRYAWSNTGLALLELGHLEEARKCFAREIDLDAGNVGAYVNLGHVLRELGRVDEAIAVYRKGLALAPRYAELHLNLGVALNALGEAHAAIEHLRKAVKLKPGYDTAHHSLIFTLDFDAQVGTAMQQDARRAWYRECVQAAGVRPGRPLRDAESQRKLRVGYVSADFRLTSAAMGFAPLLLQYDRDHFEVYCYSNSVHEDRLTERFRQQIAGFRFIGGMTDAQAAQIVTRDRIDILVDLSAHMQGNRLGLFALRPAPVQITAWGYANGTGVAEMDYILADAVYLPDELATHFSERRLDVPSVIPYHPFDALPPLPETSADLARPVRFGCYTRWQKLSTETIALWADVLERVPGAELVLKASQQTDDQGVQAMLARFLAAGVAPGRIRFLPRAGWSAHLASFAEIDIQLDPYPHGGGISLLDGVAMGVPTLTLLGRTPPGRLGAALLQSMGVGEGWIAHTREDYIALAESWAARVGELRTARPALRARLLDSTLGDPTRYARAVEAAYRLAWEDCVPLLRAARAKHLLAARESLLRADSTGAMAALEPILSGCSPDAEVLQLAGVAALQNNDVERALDYLKDSLTLDETRAEAWVNLGVLLTRCHRPVDAVKAMQRAVELQPGDAETHYNLGCIWLGLNDLNAAGAAFDTALSLRPRHAMAMNNRGVVHERQGEMEKAEASFRNVLDMDPGNVLGHGNVGRVLVEREAFEEAIPHFERALQTGQEMHWLRYELAIWYERCGYHARLPSLWKEPFKPSTAPPARGSAHSDTNKVFARITELVRAAYLRRGHGQRAMSDELLKLCGRLMEVDHAAKNLLLDEAIALDPDNLPAYLQAGISLYHDGRYPAAERRWMEGLRRRDQLAREAGLLDQPHRVLDTSWYMALGHLQMMDSYLKSVELGMRARRTLWLMRTAHHRVPNEAYLEYWRPWVMLDAEVRSGSNLPTVAQATGVPLEQLPLITEHYFADRVEGGHEHWHMSFIAEVQRRWEARGGGPLLKLKPEDVLHGRQVLSELGVPEDAWFVCLHVREPGFWGKWDRSHPSIRNARIEDYRQAIEQVVARGGWVIRMGDRTMTPLVPMAGVVDYAHSALKSERMDVFLCGAARLFVGVNSGISLLPPTFGVPCLLTNFVPISIPFPYGKDRMLPKLFRRKGSDGLLSFDQMFERGVAHAQFARYVDDDLEVMDNDPADIAEGVCEMLDEIDGRIDASELASVDTLRRRYDAMLRTHGNFLGSPVGGRFLQRYADLLPQQR